MVVNTSLFLIPRYTVSPDNVPELVGLGRRPHMAIRNALPWRCRPTCPKPICPMDPTGIDPRVPDSMLSRL